MGGKWKLNINILNYENYVQEIKNIMHRYYINNQIKNPSLNRDHMKKVKIYLFNCPNKLL